MKIMIIISILFSSMFAQNYTKKEFGSKAIELGWDYGKCSFGTSRNHINGDHSARELATSRAMNNLVTAKCGKRNGNTITASGELSYKMILQGKVKGQFVSAICERKPIICTN